MDNNGVNSQFLSNENYKKVVQKLPIFRYVRLSPIEARGSRSINWNRIKFYREKELICDDPLVEMILKEGEANNNDV